MTADEGRSQHVLVVTGTRADEGEMEVEHPAACPREETDAGYWFYVCPVGQMESDIGLDACFVHQDDPDPFYRAEKVPPGRYEIESWFETQPGGPWGPTEYSAGLCLTSADASRPYDRSCDACVRGDGVVPHVCPTAAASSQAATP